MIRACPRASIASSRSSNGCVASAPGTASRPSRPSRPTCSRKPTKPCAALDEGAPEPLEGELGDLLFQVFLLARLAQERGWFDIDDVAGSDHAQDDRASSPRLRRDPRPPAPTQVKNAWEKRKRRQPGRDRRTRSGRLPAALPALAAAYRQTLRAADLGFDWERDADVVAKIEEELAEWRDGAGSRRRAPRSSTRSATCCSRSSTSRRRRKIDPESALRLANRRFRDRFAEVARRAREAGKDVSERGWRSWTATGKRRRGSESRELRVQDSGFRA